MSELVEKLSRSLEKRSLHDLVKAKPARSLLLIDVSGSMKESVDERYDDDAPRKIDALRDVVAALRKTHPVPLVAFGGDIDGEGTHVGIVGDVPEPYGGTPLLEAIEFGTAAHATHLVVVSDGRPGNQTGCLQAARQFGGKIDVFYVGPRDDAGAQFLQQLATATGGGCNQTSLGDIKLLTSKIAGLLT